MKMPSRKNTNRPEAGRARPDSPVEATRKRVRRARATPAGSVGSSNGSPRAATHGSAKGAASAPPGGVSGGATRPVVTSALIRPAASKSASLIFFYYGDSYLTTLFQETLKLKKAMEDYRFTVLLKEEKTPSFLDLSEKDEKLADIKDLPTKENLFKYLIQLAKDGYYIDVYCFNHGYPGKFSAMKKGGGTEFVTEDDIRSELAPEKTGLTHVPIRMTWGTYCHGQTLGEPWRSIGAKTTAGARYVQFKPTAFGPFIDAWNKGDVSFDKAVADSDTGWVNTKTHAYITAHAMSCRKVWGGLPFGKTVLGDHEDVKKYYIRWRGKNKDGSWSGWLDPDEWQSGKSGKENIDYSSFMFRGGEKSLTKNRKPVW